MQDQPNPTEILKAVAAFLRDTVIPEATAHTGFQARVAANALELVAREITLAPALEEEERDRLRTLLGSEGNLIDLNDALADRLASGSINVTSPGVFDHLWQTTLAKLAIDQPRYSGYLAALADAVQPKDQ